MGTMDIWLAGKTLPGFDPKEAARALANLSGINREKALALITSGHPRLARRGLTADRGLLFIQKFSALGIKVMVKPTPLDKVAQMRRSVGRRSGKTSPELFALVVSDGTKVKRRKRAKSTTESELLDMLDEQESYWNRDPARVSAFEGLVWFWECGRILIAKPAIWGFTILLICGLAALCNLVSPVFSLVWYCILPLLAGGIAIMAEMQHDGEDFHLIYLFRGALEKPLQLSAIALCLALYIMPVLLAMYLLGGQEALKQFQSAGFLSAMLDGVVPGRVLGALALGAILMIPAIIANFFAPTLVTLAGLHPLAALRRGFHAAAVNWSALLLNGTLVLALTLVSCLVAGVTARLFILLDEQVAVLVLTVLLSALWLLATVLCQLMGYVATFALFYPEET